MSDYASAVAVGKAGANGDETGSRSQFTTPDRPTWELYSTCIHCGLCLNQCPTYRVLGLEADSPRGRIYQVLQVDHGGLSLSDSFVTHIDRCLGCRACETACPSGVQYGRILERARAEIERNYRRGWWSRILRGYFYGTVLTQYRSLTRWARWIRFYQRSGLQRLARSSGLLRVLGMEKVESLAPRIDDEFFFDEVGMLCPAQGEKRARVAFLAGCIASVAFSELNRATIRVLQRNGVEVLVPEFQGCCGALQAHGGFLKEARQSARQNIKAMLADDIDAIVTNAAGCGATMKEYGELLHADSKWAERARQFSAKVKDVTEFLVELGPRPPQKPVRARVTYQDPCHLAHGQKVRSAPRALLEVAGVELVEMARPDACCGSAGTYNVTQSELAAKVLEEKMKDIDSTQADIVATANVGCMLQLRAGVAQRGKKMEVVHVVELLDRAYLEGGGED